MNDQEVRRWLRKYGYHRLPLVSVPGKFIALCDDENCARMVRYAQAFLGLKVDGVVGPKTTTMMERPRCGCADYRRPPKYKHRGAPAFHAECRLSVGVFADWDGIQGITPSGATELMVDNFAKVAPYNLKFNVVDDQRDALISIRMGRAERGVLAWMEVGDGCDWQRQSLFNIDVQWGESLFASTNLHEVVGHGSGLGHSKTIGGVMDPVYDPSTPNEIGPWFAAELEKRYGLSDSTQTPTPPVPSPAPSPETPPGVPGMDWAAIIALILPLILDCIESGASDAAIAARIRNPTNLQRRRIERGVKRKVREEEPRMRRRERRARVDALVDSMIARGRDATDAEIATVVADAWSTACSPEKHAIAVTWGKEPCKKK